MKVRLYALFVLVSLLLASCYSSGDITPPAGYESPTAESAQGTATATQTLSPSSTPEPSTPTAEVSVASTEQATPSGEASATPEAGTVLVSGSVTNASGVLQASDLTATLYLYNSGANQVEQTLTAPVGNDGSYQFTGVPAVEAIAYLVEVLYGGVNYYSSAANYDPATAAYNLPVTVYDSTNDPTILTLDTFHVQFDFSTEGQVQVQALYIVTNPGNKTLLITSDGSSIPFILIPDGAADVQYKLASGSAPLKTTADGFAMLPGAQYQYGIFALFTYPYTRSLKLTQAFTLPVTSVTVIVPEGVRVSSKQLTDSGLQASSGTNYHLYEGKDLAAEDLLTLTISGKPGASTGFEFNRQTILMIAVAVVGLLLIGLGIFLYLRDRARAMREEEAEAEANGEGSEESSESPTDQDDLLDAIIAIDERYKNGEISKEVYKQRRAELKEQLKGSSQ